MQEPTIDAILQAAEQLYAVGEEGFSNTDVVSVGAILKAKSKQSRQVWSLWTILRPYQEKLSGLGVIYEALVPPDFSVTGTVQSAVTIGARVGLKKVETKDGPMVAVSFEYDKHLVDVVKGLKSKRWDKESKTWFVPFTPIDIEMAISTFRAEKCPLDVDPALKVAVEDGKRSYEESRAHTADIVIHTKLELYPFQRAGVKWVDDHDGRALIADEMGLGKTPEALGYLVLRPEKALPALVICPSLVRVNWYREVLRFTDLKPLIIAGKTSAPAFKRAGLEVSGQPLAGYDITITNYDLLSVETPRIWLRQLLKKDKEIEKYAEKHLAWAGHQAKELLEKAMDKYKDIDSRNRISRVLDLIEKQGDRARKERAPEYKVVYVNGIPFEEFVKAGYKTLICDESHFVKDITAQRTVAALEISGTVKNSICLTGTPIDNRPKELWSQLQIVNRTIFPKFFDFGIRHCGAFQKPAAQGQMVWDFSGVSNIAELDKTLRSTIMIRRTKDQVLKELPPKTRTMIPFVVDEAADKVYRKEEAGALDRLRALRKERNDWKAVIDSLPEADRKSYVAKHAEKASRQAGLKDLAIGEIEKLKEAAVNAKFAECIEFILDLKETQGKILVFAVHHNTIDRLVAAFRAKGIKTDFIDGRVTTTRQNVVDSFQEGDLEILVCGIRAASIGITLTASHTVVFVELDWTPGIHAQAEDRTYRIGQTKPVTVYYLLLLGSIEEKIAKMIDAKRAVVNSIMGEGDRTVQEAGILDAVLDELLDEKKAA
jgi:SWI/SNF-related matrix-associated actin-dependent regulator 1 of chromatin subfamily A